MSDSDQRYKHVRSIWAAGDLKSFREILTIIPKSIVSKDLGLNYERFLQKINKLDLLSFRDVERLSKLTNIDFKSLAGLVIDDIEVEKNGKKK